MFVLTIMNGKLKINNKSKLKQAENIVVCLFLLYIDKNIYID